MLTTGRVVYHWHTRTKTGRSPELNAAAPDVFLEMASNDAQTAVLPDNPRPVMKKAAIIASAGVLGFFIGRRKSA
jgi:hypothetical protein